MLLMAGVSAPQVLHAQTAPAAGTTVAVRMIDTVNSGSDPAGRQYRASVTHAVNSGNGVSIAQGAPATVTLTSSGSGYTARLSSITINGQQVAVTSNSASVSAVAQSAQVKAASAIGSMLGGFGHHVSAPASVVAAATGQHVFVPTGATLTFVLGQPPAASPAPQPLAASAAPAPKPASGPVATPASAGGPVTGMGVCFSNPPPFPSDPGHGKTYLTAVFEFPADNAYANGNVAAAPFAAYMAAHQYRGASITCLPIWTVDDARNAQKDIVAANHAPNLKRIDTGWRYNQPPVAQGQSGFDPLTQGPGGIDLTQHRLTTYYCKLLAPGGTSMLAQPGAPDLQTLYVSPVFQADWDSDIVSRAYQVYIQDRYVPDLSHLSQAYTNPWCGANSPAGAAMMDQTRVDTVNRHIVHVDFTYTAAQAAAGNPATASANTASAGAGPALGPNQNYAFCSSGVYFSDIFAASTPPPTGPGRGAAEEAQLAATHAYSAPFQTFLKGKYGFNGSASCNTAAGLKAAQDQKMSMEKGLLGHYRVRIVETGWKNQ
jgi:hypothetical protein